MLKHIPLFALILVLPFLCPSISSSSAYQAPSSAPQAHASLQPVAGKLDADFDGDGKVTIDVNNSVGIPTLNLQSDGKLLMAVSSGRDFVLARYQGNGSLDPTFGAAGKITVPFFHQEDLLDANSSVFAFQPDGKIIAAGTVRRLGCGRPCPALEAIGVARYDVDGTIDPSFGSTGTVTSALNFGGTYATALTLQPDGELVVLGGTQNYPQLTVTSLLIRYTAMGSIDTTFGANGVVHLDIAPDAVTTAMAIQSDGKIVVVGTTVPYSETADFLVLRYNVDGTVDSSFGSAGKALADVGMYDAARAVLIQDDGKIVVAGGTEGGAYTPGNFALARFHPDGTPDITFGTAGKVITPQLAYGIPGEQIYALTQQPDGKLIAAGSAGTDQYDDFALARYSGNGKLDLSFGNNGIVTTDFFNGFIDNIGDQAYTVLLQSDGRIVAAGPAMEGEYQGHRFIGLARYLGDATDLVFLPMLLKP
jgi:uncharacterized delta-60 repeat protein